MLNDQQPNHMNLSILDPTAPPAQAGFPVIVLRQHQKAGVRARPREETSFGIQLPVHYFGLD